MGISQELARFIKQLNFDNLPDDVVLAAKNAFLDWLGSAAAGAKCEPGRIMLSITEELGGKEEATLISTGEKTSCILVYLTRNNIED